MPYNDDGYGGGTDWSGTEAPEFQGYAVPAFSTVQEYVNWIERRPSLTTGERQLVAAIKSNPNEWEAHLGTVRPKPGFIAKYWPVLVVAAAVAAPAIASYAGGSSAAGSGVLPSATAVPTSTAMASVPQIAAGSASAGALGATGAALPIAAGDVAMGGSGILPDVAGGSLMPGTLTNGAPAAGLTTAVPQVAPSEASHGIPLGGLTPAPGQSFSDQLKAWLTPENLAKLGLTTAAAVGAAKTPNPLDDPRIQQMLDMGIKRQQRVDPLHESVTRLANAMLPTAYQGGAK